MVSCVALGTELAEGLAGNPAEVSFPMLQSTLHAREFPDLIGEMD